MLIRVYFAYIVISSLLNVPPKPLRLGFGGLSLTLCTVQFTNLLTYLCVVGAFRVEMSRSPTSDRTIQCRYYPTEIGIYYVYVLWSGEHVPGSPFRVDIVDTMEQLQILAEQLEITVRPEKFLGYGTMSSCSTKSSHSGNTLRGLIFADDF